MGSKEQKLERDGFRFTLEADEVTIEGQGEKFGATIREGQSLESFAREWTRDWWHYIDELCGRYEEDKQVYHEYIAGVYDGVYGDDII